MAFEPLCYLRLPLFDYVLPQKKSEQNGCILFRTKIQFTSTEIKDKLTAKLSILNYFDFVSTMRQNS